MGRSTQARWPGGIFEAIELPGRAAQGGPQIEICTRSFKAFKKYPIFVYTHEGKWITGQAHSYQEHSHSLWLEMNEAIKAGTSGSPILDKGGCVVGLVSNFIGENSISSVTGRAWRPHLTLPVWVCNQIFEKH